MSSPSLFVVSLIAGLFGAVLAWFFMREKAENQRAVGRLEKDAEYREQMGIAQAQLDAERQRGLHLAQSEKDKGVEIQQLREALSDSEKRAERLDTSLKAELQNAEKRKQDEDALANQFATLSRRALSENSSQFMDLAKKSFEKEQADAQGNLKVSHQAFLNIVQPVQQTIVELNTRVGRLSEDKDRLATEAKALSSALRKAEVRGRWGEIQLQRVAELAGMQNKCDFFLQETFTTDEQRKKRPDMVVRLPLGRYVVVDSKAVMDAYISACESTDAAVNLECLTRHSRLVRDKIDELAKIDYAKVLERDGKNVADMVVCFIPGEAFFSAAIANDPDLLEYAAKSRVFLASPTILITLLRAIALGWRDHQLSANAEEISKLGKELYTRLSGMKSHFDKLGDSMTKSVDHYNSMVSSLNKKVFPQARRFRDLGAAEGGAKELGDGGFIEETVRSTASADWAAPLALVASAKEEL
jgi:DNA recombination protein RmuC